MRDIGIWAITFLIAILFVAGFFYYKMIDAVENPIAFIVSLVIILLSLIVVIIYSIGKEREASGEDKTTKKANGKNSGRSRKARKKSSKKK